MAGIKRRRLRGIGRHAVLLLWAAIVLFPIFWMVATSFKDSGEWINWPPHWLPHEPTLLNYQQIFAFGLGSELSRSATDQVYTIWKAVGDSLLISSVSSLVSLFLGALMAYTMSRFNAGGGNFRYVVLTIRMVPPIAIAIPIVLYYAVMIPYTTETLFGVRAGLFDTYIGLGLLYVGPLH
jgi:multiple sugar transport system permease protein